MAKLLFHNLCAVFVALFLLPPAAWAQMSAADRAEITRLAQQRSWSEADVAPIVQDINAAAQRGVPQVPLINKVKEGLAKGIPPARIQGVVRTLVGHLDRARDLLGPGAGDATGARAVITLGEAFFRGVTPDEVTELRRLLQQGATAPAADRLAAGAQTWAMLREGGVAATTGLPLVADAVRTGARDAELARIARDAMAARQSETPTRVELPAVPERPVAPERPPTPDRPQRPERIEPRAPERR